MADDETEHKTPFDPSKDEGADAGDTTEHSDVPSDGDSSSGGSGGGGGQNVGGESEG